MPIEPNAPPQSSLPPAGGAPTYSLPPHPRPLNRSQSHHEVLETRALDPEISRMVAELQLSSEIMGETAISAATDSSHDRRTLERADSHSTIEQESDKEESHQSLSEMVCYLVTWGINTYNLQIDLTSDAPKNECIVCYDGPKSIIIC